VEIKELHKPIRLGKKTAPNRIVYQPTEANNCDDRGSVTADTIKKYVRIAQGRPGIIHIESIDVTLTTQARTNRMLILDENVPGLKRLVEEIRKVNQDSLIIFQLSHAGRLSDPALKPALSIYPTGSSRMMSTAEVQQARDEFIAAAKRAHEVGADGVDIKQAHGFLGGEFLHPANLRPDQYGGSWENRCRFFQEVLAGVRVAIKDDSFIIGTRLSPYEGIPGGCGTAGPDELIEDLTEPIAYARLMEQSGLDFINVSGGFAAANLEILLPTMVYPEGVLRLFSWAKAIKAVVSIPVIGSGYSYLRDGRNKLFIDDPEQRSLLYQAERNIARGHVDMVGIGRQSIADPLFARKVFGNQIGRIDWCTCCSGCGILLGSNKKVGCTVYDPDYRQL